ncbi:MAG: DUF507 family protein [Acidobacteria bacterium]|nr:DUF507 family protein [Acidobacteriota bacterium]
MRLTREQVELMAFHIIRTLLQEGKIEVDDREGVIDRIAEAITVELQIEDRLNDEVREILNKHSDEIRTGNVEYQTMFKMVKDKLVRERKLIL